MGCTTGEFESGKCPGPELTLIIIFSVFLGLGSRSRALDSRPCHHCCILHLGIHVCAISYGPSRGLFQGQAHYDLRTADYVLQRR